MKPTKHNDDGFTQFEMVETIMFLIDRARETGTDTYLKQARNYCVALEQMMEMDSDDSRKTGIFAKDVVA